MLKFMANAKVVLWEFVELGFVTVLAIMLIYLILGQGSGGSVLSVADNVTNSPMVCRRRVWSGWRWFWALST